MKNNKKERKNPAIQNYLWCVLAKIISFCIWLIPTLVITLKIILGALSIICLVYAFLLHEMFFLAAFAVLLIFLIAIFLLSLEFRGKLITCTRWSHEISTRPGITSQRGAKWLHAARVILPQDIENMLAWAEKHEIKKLTFKTHGEFFDMLMYYFPDPKDLKIKISSLQENGNSITCKSNSGIEVEISRLKNRKNLLYAASANITDSEDIAKRCGKLVCYMAKIDVMPKQQ